MPHIVELELSLEDGSQAGFGESLSPAQVAEQESPGMKRSDFRVHGGGQPHWLLLHPFGQELLISKLQEVRPDMKVPRYRLPVELISLLDPMIDLLEMRAWPQPKGARERLGAWMFLLKCQIMMANGRPLPDWRAHAAPAAA